MLLEVFRHPAMQREDLGLHMEAEEIHNLAEPNSRVDRANMGIIKIRVVECEVNNYADVNVDDKRSESLSACFQGKAFMPAYLPFFAFIVFSRMQTIKIVKRIRKLLSHGDNFGFILHSHFFSSSLYHLSIPQIST